MLEEPTGDSGRRPAIPTPTMLADRLGVTTTAVILGVAAVVAAALGGWWALRTPSGPAPEQLMPSVAAMPAPSLPATTAPAPLVVHVDGAVLRPGVHELPADGRVLDAVQAAGGLSENADGSRLNLAQPLNDGARLWVPSIGEEQQPDIIEPTPATTPAATGSVGGSAKVNINTADAVALQALPGIGPSLAAAIIEHRARAGPFATVGALENVAGIGPAKLEQIRPLVSV